MRWHNGQRRISQAQLLLSEVVCLSELCPRGPFERARTTKAARRNKNNGRLELG